jgi:uncharacterized caspase-like protein
MKKCFRFLLFSFLFSFFFIFPTLLFASSRGIRVTAKEGQSLYFYKDYHALVVGISDYEKWPRLPNAVSDAKEVAARLTELGFGVKVLLDPTSREMKTVLSEMVYKMGREENRALLFYYAGHGETETLADKTKMGYIIPRDCPLLDKNPMGFATHAISMRDIESASMRIKSKHVVMLFDSCFSGSLFALVRAVPHDITEKSTLPVRQYITAGREDEQVPDKSMFKRCFLVGLEGDADLTGDGYITGSELGMYLSDKVVNYTHRRQHPQYGKINNPDLDRGDFIFVPRRVQRKEMAEEKKRQEEKSAIAEELKRLQEERKKSEELVEQMKRLLEAKWQSEDKEKETLSEKEELENRLKQTEEDRQINKAQMNAKAKELASQLLASQEKLRRDAAERKALEEELKRLKAERQKQAIILKKLQVKHTQEKRLASIPKAVTDDKIDKVKLRDIPKGLLQSHVEESVKKYHFFVKNINKEGGFPNDFVDNGNGTITDRATGLMWEKGGSSSLVSYTNAKKYISRLNKERFLGYDDWRIPTLEELCSLLEREKNERGQYISSLFKDTQSKCLSADRFAESRYVKSCGIHNIVNFTKGEIDETATENMGDSWCQRLSVFFYTRAVRSIKGLQVDQSQENRLASIPKAVTDDKIYKVNLRYIPKELVQSDIKKMIKKRNFFVKGLNDNGDFPNDFVDNADGTITDRATGLMWEKEGFSSTLYYWKAEKYVSRLNKEKFLGYNDWRIPTLEELCSLLEQKVNERGQYISSLFKDTQSKCLSADRFGGGSNPYFCVPYNIVNFSKGKIDETATENVGSTYCQSVYCSIRAVRSIK